MIISEKSFNLEESQEIKRCGYSDAHARMSGAIFSGNALPKRGG